MEIVAPPSKKDYTVYTKSGCPFCDKVKNLLFDFDLTYTTVVCDAYLSADRDAFLLSMQQYTKREYKTFPMVFHNGVFVGGFTDTKQYIDDQLFHEFSYDSIFK